MPKTYRVEVTYKNSDGPLVSTGLTVDQAVIASGAFTRDLTGLGGEGVTRMVIEVEPVADGKLVRAQVVEGDLLP